MRYKRILKNHFYASYPKSLLLVAFWCSMSTVTAQQSPADTTFWSRIFLPSIDIGYQIPNASSLQGAIRIGTSIEYRIRNNNDFFLRLQYDTYNARYTLPGTETTHALEGTVSFTDIVAGAGYRVGDRTFRCMFAALAGVKNYEFPMASIAGQRILIRSKARSTFTTLFLGTLEYIDHKSALTLGIYQNQVWRRQDFWTDGGGALGLSLGFITSLL